MKLSVLLIGNEALTLQCGDMLRQRGHEIAAVVTRSADLRHWASGHEIGRASCRERV